MTTPADELRAAATRLRELAVAVPAPPWKPGGIGDYGWTIHIGDTTSRDWTSIDTRMDDEQGRALARFIAAMHPGIGAALADWLDTVADLHEQPTHRGQTRPGCQWCNDEDWLCADTRHALTVARHINHTPKEN